MMKEEEIRPQAMFNRYLDVARTDIERFFSDKRSFIAVACPGCGEDEPRPGFDKFGFQYVVCGVCTSLYLSPRPTAAMIDQYYREGEAVRFWSSEFYRQTAEARREKIYRPRAEHIGAIAQEYTGPATRFVDVGSGYGIFLQEVQRTRVFQELIGIEPAPNMAAEGRAKGFEIVERSVEEMRDGELAADFATSFEVLEHVFSPEDFLVSIRRVLRPGGVLYFTTLTISGFDLQVLWNNSKSIYPPHHINLISYEGMVRLVTRAGFSVQKMTTPGKLDVDIVRNAVREDPTIPLPRFVEYLLSQRESALDAFQQFLQAHNLSSHIQCVCQRKD